MATTGQKPRKSALSGAPVTPETSDFLAFSGNWPIFAHLSLGGKDGGVTLSARSIELPSEVRIQFACNKLLGARIKSLLPTLFLVRQPDPHEAGR
jgi:hypothetical protein